MSSVKTEKLACLIADWLHWPRTEFDMKGQQNSSSSTASRTVTVDRAKYLLKISVGPHLLQADDLSDVGIPTRAPAHMSCSLCAG
jgi:hypothetical protein